MTDEYTVLWTYDLEDNPAYWFLGGMRYSKDGNPAMTTAAVIEYPYTTYYRRKIQAIERDGTVYRPLAELRLPLLVYQYSGGCDAFRLDPVLATDDGTVHPFIGYNDADDRVEVIVPERYTVKEKNAEWLGKGREKRVANPDPPQAYSPERLDATGWEDAVETFYADRLDPPPPGDHDLRQVFDDAKQALYRGWDDDLGTFLQLPWRDRPGFALSEYSYSLLASEAARLEYCSRLYDETEDEAFREWYERLQQLFTDDNLYTTDLRHGDGLVWYNTATYDGDGLSGRFYLETGYYGYPGGQATIALHLLRFLQQRDSDELEERVRESLIYLLSTQQDNGRWPTTLRQEWELPFKRTDIAARDSEGATAECCRALLAAYSYFDEERYREAAIDGLETLVTDMPVCYNGLRDIGTNEVEAFSAFAVIHAFLDAYDLDGDEQFLEQAATYGRYLATWQYWFSNDAIDLRGIAHPIAETITMRASPFETVLAARAYRRLADRAGEEQWRQLYRQSLDRALDLVNDSGGLSEGWFFSYEDGFLPLETEQSFATAALLHTVADELSFDTEQEAGDRDTPCEVAVEDGAITVPALDTVFDPATMTFTRLFGEQTHARLEYAGPHSWKSRLRSHLFNALRGHDLLLAVKDIPALWRGVRPATGSNARFRPVDGTVHSIDPVDDGEVTFQTDTGVYSIAGTVTARTDPRRLEMELEIDTDRHDLLCDGVRFTLPDFRLGDASMQRDDVVASMDEARPMEEGFDLSLSTNWTHGGTFTGLIRFEEISDA